MFINKIVKDITPVEYAFLKKQYAPTQRLPIIQASQPDIS